MSMQWIRSTYGIPAKRGMRVIADGKPGVITGSRGGYLIIRLDGWEKGNKRAYHPTWEMQYLQGTQDKSTPETSKEVKND